MDTNEILNTILSVFTASLVAIIGYFIKDKFRSQAEADRRIEGKIDTTNSKLDKVCDRVSHIEGRMGIGYLASASPVKLTDKGNELLKESGIKEILDSNKDYIFKKIISAPKPVTAYDAQEKTKEVISSLADDPIFIPVKDYAFTKGMELPIILSVASIYFRDFVLEKLNLKPYELEIKS